MPVSGIFLRRENGYLSPHATGDRVGIALALSRSCFLGVEFQLRDSNHHSPHS
ncbi:hypothetical protein SBC1_37410 (plasmid) [Caballeronia sp. SBC1]|nr:hypothetical protein SBC2_50530 [Caballeronia sp. SBC2]QIN63701.1 hypothetical protein SBC1_37410 [Caballeronia sp. SBC1]